MSKVISIANSKGGSTKSSTTMFLAGCLAKEGNKVIVLDADSQASILETYQYDKEHGKPLFEVEPIKPERIEKWLSRWQDEYDFIFIDIPRITNSEDNKNTFMLYGCEFVFVPTIGSQLDVMSTVSFISTLETIKSDLSEYDYPFNYYGFIAKRNRRTDNKEAETVLSDKGLTMMQHSIPDLKIFAVQSTSECILDTPEGKRRFEPFYNEFKKLINE